MITDYFRYNKNPYWKIIISGGNQMSCFSFKIFFSNYTQPYVEKQHLLNESSPCLDWVDFIRDTINKHCQCSQRKNWTCSLNNLSIVHCTCSGRLSLLSWDKLSSHVTLYSRYWDCEVSRPTWVSDPCISRENLIYFKGSRAGLFKLLRSWKRWWCLLL